MPKRKSSKRKKRRKRAPGRDGALALQRKVEMLAKFLAGLDAGDEELASRAERAWERLTLECEIFETVRPDTMRLGKAYLKLSEPQLVAVRDRQRQTVEYRSAMRVLAAAADEAMAELMRNATCEVFLTVEADDDVAGVAFGLWWLHRWLEGKVAPRDNPALHVFLEDALQDLLGGLFETLLLADLESPRDWEERSAQLALAQSETLRFTIRLAAALASGKVQSPPLGYVPPFHEVWAEVRDAFSTGAVARDIAEVLAFEAAWAAASVAAKHLNVRELATRLLANLRKAAREAKAKGSPDAEDLAGLAEMAAAFLQDPRTSTLFLGAAFAAEAKVQLREKMEAED